MNDLVGRTLGQYRIVEQLGKGGMATVYRAYQPSLERHVAIKVLMPYFAHEEGFGQRFVREAQAIARLDHPHILPIYDYGQEGEYHYIVMKCVDAGTLGDLEARESLTLEQSAGIVSQIAEALDHAHRQGIIHRDVKPANVLMDRGEWVLLTDFGLAKMVESSQRLTASGVGVGTPAYMPPEQGRGQPINERADVYSLGIVLYEMLTGGVPFEAETPLAVVLKHITSPLPLPRTINPAIPEAVELVILKALAKEPADRYQSAGEMAAALCLAVECGEATAPPDVPDVGSVEEEPVPHLIVANDPAVESPSVSEPLVHRSIAQDSSARAVELVDLSGSEQPREPARARRRTHRWVYLAASVVVLFLAVGGLWLGFGGWSRLARSGADPALPGGQTLVPPSAVVADRSPTATASAAEPALSPTSTPVQARAALSPAGTDARLLVVLSVRPGPHVEVGAKRLSERLTAGTGLMLEAIAVDSREELQRLVREGVADAVLVSMPEYLWLRDEKGLALQPILYADPLFAEVVVVRADDDLGDVQGLRGQAVAFLGRGSPVGMLARAALMDRGLDVERECEVIYVEAGDAPEAVEQVLALLNDREVAAAVLSNLAWDRFMRRAPQLGERLRVLTESPPTSTGVVAVQPDLSSQRIVALREALLALEPGTFDAGMFANRLVAADEPLTDHVADALRKLGLSAAQWLEGGGGDEPPVPASRPSGPAAPGDLRVALVPAAGTSIETLWVALIFEGLQRISRQLRFEFVVRETPEDESPGDATLDLIEQGYNVIVAVGWQDTDMLWGIAREHADVKFVHFWHLYQESLPNLVGFAFRHDQAGFLAGMLAGRATESKRVAVIGGPPIAAVEELVSGFGQGVQRACPECEVLVRSADSWENLALGEEFGRQVVEEGADVVFGAAGEVGGAAVRSAAQQGAWVIGLDVDAYRSIFGAGRVPNADRLLGSVVLRADRPVLATFERLLSGGFEPGGFALGVAEGGFEFLASPESSYPRQPELEQYAQEITDGFRRGEFGP